MRQQARPDHGVHGNETLPALNRGTVTAENRQKSTDRRSERLSHLPSAAIMRYSDALRYLNTFRNFESRPADSYGRELNLKRMVWLLGQFGSPEKNIRFVLVAGTKGKGSTACLLASILSEAGCRTGLYTSPHLLSPCERMRINGQAISRNDFGKLFRRVREQLGKVGVAPWGSPTYFEVMTLGAFLYFAQRKVSAAVLETGLGGRLDATNAVDPLISVLTPISYDHMDQLGNSLPAIAREKWAIVRKRGVLVCGRQPTSVRSRLSRWIREKKVKAFLFDKDFRAIPEDLTERGSFFSLRLRRKNIRHLFVSLPGSFQIENAACAVQAAELLRSSFGFRISGENIRSGLGKVSWEGRFQVLSHRPLVLVDGAHNGASFRALRESILTIFPGKKVTIILGLSSDKDLKRISGELACFEPERIIATQARNPRAMSAELLAEQLREKGLRVRKAAGLSGALKIAFGRGNSKDVFLITGSLFLVGEALRAFKTAKERAS